MRVLNDTLTELDKLRTMHDSVLVGFSGGKDSLACMSLAKQKFKRVVAFHMEMIPGLQCIEDDLRVARDLWDVEVLRYTHWLLPECLKRGIYTWEPEGFEVTPWTLADVFRVVQRDTGIPLVFWDAKLKDSAYRRRTLNKASYQGVHYPLKQWSKFEVMAFLKSRDIPLPAQVGVTAGGVDLSTPSLLWLHDNHPQDFAKLERYFPFAGAVVARREMYGDL